MSERERELNRKALFAKGGKKVAKFDNEGTYTGSEVTEVTGCGLLNDERNSWIRQDSGSYRVLIGRIMTWYKQIMTP